MENSADTLGKSALPEPAPGGIEQRIFRTMIAAVALAVAISLPLAPMRITFGVALGGLLSLFNHRWLSRSTAAAFSVLAHGARPRLAVTQYVLRYVVVGVVVGVAYKLNLVSLGATIAGLCSFVVALFAEASREFYFAIIHREEIS